jgi:regulation of enolase protein 1 (concanavalin A-like superfamily)
MIRASLDEAASNFFLIEVQASGNLVCRWRDDPNDNKSKEIGKVTLPVHLKLTRKGKEVQVFTSTDGRNWGEPRMSHSATYAETSRIGLFVCSGNTVAASTATYENVASNAQ